MSGEERSDRPRLRKAGDRPSIRALQHELQTRLHYFDVAVVDSNYRRAAEQSLAMGGVARELTRLCRERQV